MSSGRDGSTDTPSDVDSGEPGSLISRIESSLDDDDDLERAYLERVADPTYPEQLKTALASLLEDVREFSVGDLVTWKPLLRNRFFPSDGAPAIVVDIDPQRVSEEYDPDSARYGEPLDLQLGVIGPDGKLLIFHFDSRRFTYWEAPD